ncbi:hypothetical protein DFH09DRAFT_1222690 [Mycena vulgaris]|nr:hypothetical protein DFH09DRAFT_1222690 [Mycena vulgaris]
MCPLHSYPLLAVAPSLRCPIFPLHIPFGPRQSLLLVTTYSALSTHSGFPLWSGIRIAATPPFHTPPFSSMWSRRFLLPAFPHRPARGAFSLPSCLHLHLHSFRSPVFLPSRSIRPPTHPLPLPLRPTTTLIPIPIPSRACHAVPLSAHVRARASSVVYFVLPFLYISSIDPLWSFPFLLVAPLPSARPPTRQSPRFHPF